MFATLFAFVPTADAMLGFTDDAEIPSWAVEAIEELMDQGIVSGNDDGSFAPARALNRAEVSKIITLAADLAIVTPATPTYPDVAPGAWYFDFVESMTTAGHVSGYPDGDFRPEVTINRAELAKMVVNAFGLPTDTSGAEMSDVMSDQWYYGFVKSAVNAGVMVKFPDNTFQPGTAVTRAETIRVVYDAMLYAYGSGMTTGTTTGTTTGATTPTVGVADGTLMVELSPNTPAGISVPFNYTAMPYTTTTFTAGGADIEIAQITFTRLGLGDSDDFDKCWIEIDGFKVGNDRTVTNDDTATLSFTPPVIVPAGMTVETDFVCSAEYSSNQNTGSSASSLDDRNIGHRNRFAIVSDADIISSAITVTGSFPIEGEEMQIADYAVSNIEFTDLGTNSTIEVGDEYMEIGKFRILNDSNSNKDVELRAITFENIGDADLYETLENVALYVNGVEVSLEAIIDGDYITFRLDDGVTGGYIIEDGDSRVFSIRGDVIAAEVGDSIQFKLDNHEDVIAIEIGTSFGVRVLDENGNDAEDGNATLALYNIDAGDLNVSRDPSSPSTQQYAPGANEVLAAVVKVNIDQPLEVDGVVFHVMPGSFVASKDGDTVNDEIADFNEAFDNFRLYVDDMLIDTIDDLTIVTGADGVVDNYGLVFDTNFDITSNTTMKIVMNVEDAADSGDKIKFQVAATDFDSPEYLANGDSIPTAKLLGVAQLSVVEVIESKLEIYRTDGYALTTNDLVAGETSLDLLDFTLDNNDSGDVNVTSIAVKAIATAGTPAADFGNYTAALFMETSLSDGTAQVVQIGSSRNFSSTGDAVFNDISAVIPSNEEIEFSLVVDTTQSSAVVSTPVTTVVDPLGALSLAADIKTNDQFFCLNASLTDVDTINVDTASGTNPGVAGGGSPYGANSAAYNAAAAALVTYPTATGGLQLDGDIITVSTDGTPTSLAAEQRRVVEIVDAGLPFTTMGTDLAGLQGGIDNNADGLFETAPCPTGSYAVLTTHVFATDQFTFSSGHTNSTFDVYRSNYTYAGPTANRFYVANAAPFLSLIPGSSTVTVTDSTGAPVTGCLRGINSTTLPYYLDIAPNCTGALTPMPGTYSTGSVITSAATGFGQIRFAVTQVEADNVDNGQDVAVCKGTPTGGDVEIGATVSEAVIGDDAECDLQFVGDTTINPGATPSSSAPMYLCGARFDLTNSGSLYVESIIDTDVYSDVLVADQTDATVLKLNFNAANDDIQISDVYLFNDVDGITGIADNLSVNQRLDFMLYNEAGQLLDTESMQTNGKIHFELNPSNYIVVPKDDSYTVTVKVDVRNINDDLETARRLRLGLDTSAGFSGVEAITAATNDDVPGANIFATGTLTGDDFVIYRTQMVVKHGATQPPLTLPSSSSQKAYYFTVSADSAHDMDLGRVSFDLSVDGMASATTFTAADFNVFLLDNSFNPITTSTVVEGIDVIGDGCTATVPATATDACVVVEFKDQGFAAGSSKTYGLFINNTVDTSAAGVGTTDDRLNIAIFRDSLYPQSPAYGTDGSQDGATAHYFIAGGVAPCTTPTTGTGCVSGLTTTAPGVGTVDQYYRAGDIFTFIDMTTTPSTVWAAEVVAVAGGEVEFITPTGVMPPGTAVVSRPGTIVWSDEADPTHGDYATADWTNGYLLDVDTTPEVIAN